MAWDHIKGAWMDLRGTVREQWGKITDDDFEKIAGQRDQLIGKTQQHYGTAREKVEHEVAAFEKTVAAKLEVGGEKISAGVKTGLNSAGDTLKHAGEALKARAADTK
jgi:uncharacterized protein YjbJ (UPF0337 family)